MPNLAKNDKNFNFLRFTSINTCFKNIRKDNDFSTKFIMGASEGASETHIHKIVNKKLSSKTQKKNILTL